MVRCIRNMLPHLFTMYVNDEYTAKKMEMVAKKLGKKLGSEVEMKWQWVKDGKKRCRRLRFL